MAEAGVGQSSSRPVLRQLSKMRDTDDNVIEGEVLQPVGAGGEVGPRYYGVVEPPLDEADGGEAEQHLDDQPYVEGVLHGAAGGLEAVGVEA